MRLLIGEYCTRRGISQSRLSRMSDVSLKAIRAAWKEDHDIKMKTLEKIARALGVSICNLIEEERKVLAD